MNSFFNSQIKNLSYKNIKPGYIFLGRKKKKKKFKCFYYPISMVSICFYFQVHQPIRTRGFYTPHKPWTDILNNKLFDYYFDRRENKTIFNKVAKKCYFPANDTFLYLIDQFKAEKRKLKISYSLSGVFIEQAKMFNPDVLESFKALARTGCVEFLNETYYHSLSCKISEEEFVEQIKAHRKLIFEEFNQRPKVFRNTELLYNNKIASIAEKLGFKGIIAEGIDWVLDGWRSPNYVYQPVNCQNIKILLKNYLLSDDIAFRFSARWWDQWPLDAYKFASWLAANQGHSVNLFMDYETFGEHQWDVTGIFYFLKALPYAILKYDHLDFATPSELIEKEPVGTIDVPDWRFTSWADMERDDSAWLGNQMQKLAFAELQALEQPIKTANNKHLLRIWRLLQTSDHFYYMSTKGWDMGHLPDGDVHNYFSHFSNPYYAGISYILIISDFKTRVLEELARKTPDKQRNRKAKIRILTALYEGSIPLGDIAHETGLSEEFANKCLDNLIEHGYILEEKTQLRLSRKGFETIRLLLPISGERAFNFFNEYGNFVGITAHNFLEFLDAIKNVPEHCIRFHLSRGDFENWVRFVLEDSYLADKIKKLDPNSENIQEKLFKILENRKIELLANL